jgi:hypothetical protein
MTKDEFKKEIERLFEILKTGEKEDFKLAKKQIEKLYHNNRAYSKNNEDVIFEIVNDFENIKDIPHKLAVLSGLKLPVLYVRAKNFTEIYKFILGNLENSDGHIREASRNLGSWFRFEYRNDKKRFEDFIDNIEILMKKHEPDPDQKPFYLGDMKPSVYKTLVSFWHDMASGTSKYYENREELMDTTSNERIPFLGKEDDGRRDSEGWEEEGVDYQDVFDSIWSDKKAGNSEDANVWLKNLEEMSQKRLESQIKSLGFTDKESVDMFANLCIFGQDAHPKIIEDLYLSGKIEQDITGLSKINNFMRAIYLFNNHRVLKNKYGNISHLLVEALIEKECIGSGQPRDLVSFVKLICQSHEEIDNFMDWHENKNKERLEWRINFSKEHSISADNDIKYLKELKEEEGEDKVISFFGRSVAHHALDWHIQSNPVGFNRTVDPKKVAASVLMMIKDYNIMETKGEICLNYDNKDLSNFGGWKGVSCFAGSEHRVTHPILEMVGDKTLLLIDPSKLDKERFMWM